jgi:phage terminase large subunit GpA-like protein
VKLWLIGTDTAKDRIFARMKIPVPGPGYMHLPEFAEEEYLAQLTSEKAVRRYRRGKGTIREYIKTRARNEALDLEVYALAALYVLGHAAIRKLKDFAAALQFPPEGTPVGSTNGPKGGSEGASERSATGSAWVHDW